MDIGQDNSAAVGRTWTSWTVAKDLILIAFPDRSHAVRQVEPTILVEYQLRKETTIMV